MRPSFLPAQFRYRNERSVVVEFLVDMMTRVPDGTSASEVDYTKDREATRASEPAEQGYLVRLWKPPVQPGEWRTLGLWHANDEKQLRELLAT